MANRYSPLWAEPARVSHQQVDLWAGLHLSTVGARLLWVVVCAFSCGSVVLISLRSACACESHMAPVNCSTAAHLYFPYSNVGGPSMSAPTSTPCSLAFRYSHPAVPKLPPDS